jgi:hypothetical protein
VSENESVLSEFADPVRRLRAQGEREQPGTSEINGEAAILDPVAESLAHELELPAFAGGL